MFFYSDQELDYAVRRGSRRVEQRPPADRLRSQPICRRKKAKLSRRSGPTSSSIRAASRSRRACVKTRSSTCCRTSSTTRPTPRRAHRAPRSTTTAGKWWRCTMPASRPRPPTAGSRRPTARHGVRRWARTVSTGSPTKECGSAVSSSTFASRSPMTLHLALFNAMLAPSQETRPVVFDNGAAPRLPGGYTPLATASPDGTATWTIPLTVSINLGFSAVSAARAAPGPSCARRDRGALRPPACGACDRARVTAAARTKSSPRPAPQSRIAAMSWAYGSATCSRTDASQRSAHSSSRSARRRASPIWLPLASRNCRRPSAE